MKSTHLLDVRCLALGPFYAQLTDPELSSIKLDFHGELSFIEAILNFKASAPGTAPLLPFNLCELTDTTKFRWL